MADIETPTNKEWGSSNILFFMWFLRIKNYWFHWQQIEFEGLLPRLHTLMESSESCRSGNTYTSTIPGFRNFITIIDRLIWNKDFIQLIFITSCFFSELGNVASPFWTCLFYYIRDDRKKAFYSDSCVSFWLQYLNHVFCAADISLTLCIYYIGWY